MTKVKNVWKLVLVVVVMSMFVAGCGADKKGKDTYETDITEIEQEEMLAEADEEDQIPTDESFYYGTWETSAIVKEDEDIWLTMSQMAALGMDEAKLDLIIVFKEDGTCEAVGGSQSWEMAEGGIAIGGVYLPYKKGCLLLEDEKTGFMLALEKISDSQETSVQEGASKEAQVDDTAKTDDKDGAKDNASVVTENGIRPDFKEAMDSYEAFMDEYCEFMRTYSESDNVLSLMNEYIDYMTKYADCVDKFEKWESEDLNNEEMKYYLDVQTRVNKKMLDAVSN